MRNVKQFFLAIIIVMSAVFSVFLTQSIMSFGSDADPNTVLLLHFDGNVEDSTGLNQNVDVFGNVDCNTEGIIGQACDFDGNGDYVTYAHTKHQNLRENTIEAWVKPHTTSEEMVILYKANDRKNNDGLRIRLEANGQFLYSIRQSTDASTVKGGNANKDEWNYIAGTYDGNKVTLYVNGKEVASRSALDGSSPLKLGNGPLTIGALNEPNANTKINNYFDGLIDDVRVLDRSLSQAEILSNYQEGIGLPSLVSISVNPVNPAIDISQSQQFTAVGTFSGVTTKDLTNEVIWSSSNSGVATISSGGLASALTAGTTVIKATSNGVVGQTTLTVNNPIPDTTAPAISNIQASPTASDAIITWDTDEASTSEVQFGLTSAYGSIISGSGLVTSHSITLVGLSAETLHHFKLTSEDASGNLASTNDLTFITTSKPTLVAVSVNPSNPSIEVNGKQSFTAVGKFSDGTTSDLTNAITWTSSNLAVAAFGSNDVTGISAGTTIISAISGLIIGQTTLTVNDAPDPNDGWSEDLGPLTSGKRQNGVVYQNNHNVPKRVSITINGVLGGRANSVMYVGKSSVDRRISHGDGVTDPTQSEPNHTHYIEIPPGWYYQLVVHDGFIERWFEWPE
jgi:hypothetical protein